ncbi:CRH12 Extracellular glycosidase CRH12 [Candida maltosa Xu316]
MILKIFILFLVFMGFVITDDDSYYTTDDDYEENESDYEIQRCNPYKDNKCFVINEALGKNVFETFSEGTKYFTITSSRRGVKFDSEGLKLTINDAFDNPALASSFYIMYGRVEAEIKGAEGKGIISSFYMQSDDLDEIDVVEIFGSDPFEFQTNYFIKGNTTTYDRGRYHQMHPSPLSQFHKYGVEWTPDLITWYLDGKPVRMLGRKNLHGMPCSPILWSADANDEGTILWAGGVAKFSEGPFSMHIKNLEVHDYSNGLCYSYGYNKNGQWKDLSADGGKILAGHRNCKPPVFKDHLEETFKSTPTKTYPWKKPETTSTEDDWSTVPTGSWDEFINDTEEEEEELETPVEELTEETESTSQTNDEVVITVTQEEDEEDETGLSSYHNTSQAEELSSIKPPNKSKSKSKLPYDVFIQYPDKDNINIQSGVTTLEPASLMGVVFVQILIFMTLVLL